jgi:hypothetical protein
MHKSMSPVTLIVVIALGVAIGLAVAPYVGVMVAITVGVFLVAAFIFLVLFVLRTSVQQGLSLKEKFIEVILVYFQAILNAWSMLVRPSDIGDGFSFRRRFNGITVLFVCLVWAVVAVGVILLLLFPT